MNFSLFNALPHPPLDFGGFGPSFLKQFFPESRHPVLLGREGVAKFFTELFLGLLNPFKGFSTGRRDYGLLLLPGFVQNSLGFLFGVLHLKQYLSAVQRASPLRLLGKYTPYTYTISRDLESKIEEMCCRSLASSDDKDTEIGYMMSLAMDPVQ